MYIRFVFSFSTSQGEKKNRLGSVIYALGIPISRFPLHVSPRCSYSYYTIVSSDVSFYSFKLHGLCVYVRASDVRVDVECVCECEET